MRRYVVLGGSGFVGVYAIGALKMAIDSARIEKGEIINIDIAPPKNVCDAKFIQSDIAKNIDFEFRKDDIVVHLAVRDYAPKSPVKAFSPHCLKEYFFSVNVEGTKNVIAKMKEGECENLIYFSTDMVYGKPQYLPLDSAHPRNPIGYYGLSKKVSEDFIIANRKNADADSAKITAGGGHNDSHCNNSHCNNSRHINATIFRPRMILGAGRYGILLKLFKLMDLNLPLPLIGQGNNCYQMVSVQDCAEAIICAIEKGIPNDEFNLGSQNPPQIKQLLTFVARESGSKSVLIPTWARGVKWILGMLELFGVPLMYKEQFEITNEQYIIDISKTQNLLGWAPKHNDKDMLLEAYTHYRQRKKRRI